MAHVTLIGNRDIQSAVGAILGPHHLISGLHWSYYSSHGIVKLPTRKVDQSTFNIGYTGDGYLLNVSVGWGNIIN